MSSNPQLDTDPDDTVPSEPDHQMSDRGFDTAGIMYRCGSPDWNEVKKFIQGGGDVNIVENDCKTEGTFLHNAIRDGNTEIVDFLLNSGANIEIRNFLDMTPLFFAARFNQFEIAKLLLAKGARVDVKSSWGRGVGSPQCAHDYKVPRDKPLTPIAFARRHGNMPMYALFKNALKKSQ